MRSGRLQEMRREREDVLSSLAAAEKAVLVATTETEKTLREIQESGVELERERLREQELQRTKVALETQLKLLRDLEAVFARLAPEATSSTTFGLLLVDGMSRREYDGLIRRRRKRVRLLVTIVYALVGAVVGVAFLLFLGRR